MHRRGHGGDLRPGAGSRTPIARSLAAASRSRDGRARKTPATSRASPSTTRSSRPEGKGFRLTTGPAALYWSPANTGKGDYSVKATFTEAKQTYNHPHPFGVFIGGAGLDSATPAVLYCAAYRNGNFIVRGFSGGKRFDVVAKPTPNAAVKTAASAETEVVQEVGWNVRGDKVECVVNGTAVWSGTKADVTGDGKLPSTDGIAGIRVSHNSDAMVTGFAVGK